MVDIVKTSSNVAFDEPRRAFELVVQIGQRRMATASGSKAMRTVPKPGFVVSFQYHSQHLLHQLIREVRESQRACPSAFLWDPNSTGWMEVKLFIS